MSQIDIDSMVRKPENWDGAFAGGRSHNPRLSNPSLDWLESLLQVVVSREYQPYEDLPPDTPEVFVLRRGSERGDAYLVRREGYSYCRYAMYLFQYEVSR
jgi:hypothetical protein